MNTYEYGQYQINYYKEEDGRWLFRIFRQYDEVIDTFKVPQGWGLCAMFKYALKVAEEHAAANRWPSPRAR